MQKFIFGAILVAFALYRPKGLIPAKNKRFDENKLKSKKILRNDELGPDNKEVQM